MYTEEQLISFGLYLLSQQREDSINQTKIEVPESLDTEIAKRLVYDADLANWKALQEHELKSND